MDNLFDVIMQGMRDSFPKLNWKLGSVIRSLLVEPLTGISKQIAEYSNKLEQSLDLENIVNHPAGKDTELNIWMDRLGIPEIDPVPATGTVMLVLNEPIDLTIVEGARFTWGDEITLYSTKRTDWDISSYRAVSSNRYMAEIEVTTQTGSAVSLSSGDPLNWENAPDAVVDIYVQSPITGGHSGSYRDKANAIRSLLSSPTAGGEDSIRASVLRQFGNKICDVQLGSRKFSGAVSEVPIFVKQSAAPSLIDIQITPEVKDNKFTFTVDTSGIVEFLGIYTHTGMAIKLTPVPTKDRGELGESGSYRVFTADAINYPFTYIARGWKYADATDAVAWLNSTQMGLPFRMASKLPAYVSLDLQIPTGSSTMPLEAKNAICEYINNSGLNTAIHDSEISQVLADYRITVTGTILYIAYLKYRGISTTLSQLGGVSMTGNLLLNDTPAAMYSYVTNIKSY